MEFSECSSLHSPLGEGKLVEGGGEDGGRGPGEEPQQGEVGGHGEGKRGGRWR
jgi:hypothetical protein